MKKLFILILTLSIFSACDTELQEIKNPKSYTTLKMAENLDTIVVHFTEHSVYIMENGMAKHRLVPYENGRPPTSIAYSLIVTILCIVFFIAMMTSILD